MGNKHMGNNKSRTKDNSGPLPATPDSAILIGTSRLGGDAKPFLIAEIAQAHDGSLGAAHAYVDAVAGSGFDAIKFQTHIADAESTVEEPFRVAFSRQDATRYDYWRRMEFTFEQWAGLATHAKERGLEFLSSAFSIAAVELLERIGVPAWKIGSGEFGSWNMLEVMARTGKPILVSTGISDMQEIAATISYIQGKRVPFAVFQCTSSYPTPLEQCGLNVMDEFRARFDCPVGLSDHSGQIYPGLMALARGADMLEVHAVFDRKMFGPDVCVSLTMDELALLARARDAFAVIDANPVDKEAVAAKLRPMREIFTRSLAPTRDLKRGEILSPDMLTTKKPGTGIAPDRIAELTGKRLGRNVPKDRLLAWEDVEK